MRLTITQLSSREQVGVGLVVSVAAIFCFHLLWLGPARAGMAAREQALAAARVEIARAEAREREAPEVQRLQRSLAARADLLHAAAARAPDAPGILRDVQAMAAESELWVTGFKPVPPVGREHVIESSVALQFEGTYAAVVRYLEAVAGYPRLVTVTDLQLHAHPRPDKGAPWRAVAGSSRSCHERFRHPPLTRFGPHPPAEREQAWPVGKRSRSSTYQRACSESRRLGLSGGARGARRAAS